MSEGEAPSAQLQQFVKDQEATAQLSQITSHITEVCLLEVCCCLCRTRLCLRFHNKALYPCCCCELVVLLGAAARKRRLQVCWDKCMGTPGRTLTSREMTCLSDCARRYIESAQVRGEAKLFALRFTLTPKKDVLLKPVCLAQFITQKYAQKDAGGGGGSRY
jgi:hypothetical protein